MKNKIETWYKNNQDRLDEMYAEHISMGDWGSGEDSLYVEFGSDIHDEWVEDRYYEELELTSSKFNRFVDGYKKFYLNGGFVIDLGIILAFILYMS